MSYQLQVYGYTWEGAVRGFRSTHTYSVPAPITTDVEANRAASDFCQLIDWRLVERSSASNSQRRGNRLTNIIVNTERVLRGFRNGMSPSRFARMQGC